MQDFETELAAFDHLGDGELVSLALDDPQATARELAMAERLQRALDALADYA